MGKQVDKHIDLMFQIKIEDDFKLIRKLLNNIEDVHNLVGPENKKQSQRILSESIDLALDRMNVDASGK